MNIGLKKKQEAAVSFKVKQEDNGSKSKENASFDLDIYFYKMNKTVSR